MIFKEVQRFTQWWLKLIIISANGVIIFISISSFVKQIINKERFGDYPMSDQGLMIFTFITLLSSMILVWGFFTARLEVVINKNGIRYKFYPIHWDWRTITKNEIINYKVTTFNRVLEYGGFGFRRTFRNGLGIIMKGDWGLKIFYGRSNKKIMLGTQKPNELQKALEQMMNSTKTTVHG